MLKRASSCVNGVKIHDSLYKSVNVHPHNNINSIITYLFANRITTTTNSGILISQKKYTIVIFLMGSDKQNKYILFTLRYLDIYDIKTFILRRTKMFPRYKIKYKGTIVF